MITVSINHTAPLLLTATSWQLTVPWSPPAKLSGKRCLLKVVDFKPIAARSDDAAVNRTMTYHLTSDLSNLYNCSVHPVTSTTSCILASYKASERKEAYPVQVILPPQPSTINFYVTYGATGAGYHSSAGVNGCVQFTMLITPLN